MKIISVVASVCVCLSVVSATGYGAGYGSNYGYGVGFDDGSFGYKNLEGYHSYGPSKLGHAFSGYGKKGYGEKSGYIDELFLAQPIVPVASPYPSGDSLGGVVNGGIFGGSLGGQDGLLLAGFLLLLVALRNN